MLSDTQIEMIKSRLDSGMRLRKILSEAKISEAPKDVREQLFEKYGRAEIRPLLTKERPRGKKKPSAIRLANRLSRLVDKDIQSIDDIDALTETLRATLDKLKTKEK